MMRRRIVVGMAVALAVGLVLGLAASAMAGDGSTTSQKPARTITVTSTATVTTAPDEAVVTFGVESESPDSATALSTNAQDMQAVIDALKAAGVQEADIQTLAVSLNQRTV